MSAVRAERSSEWTASILQGIFTRKNCHCIKGSDRNAKGVVGVGNGKGYPPPQPNSESGERRKLPQRSSGLSGNDFGDF